MFVQAFPAQTQLGQGGWAKGRQQHIGLAQQLVQGSLSGIGFEVEGVVFHPFVHQRVTVWRVVLHRIARWGIDFGASCAHLGQAHQCRRSGQVQGKADNARAAQGFCR